MGSLGGRGEEPGSTLRDVSSARATPLARAGSVAGIVLLLLVVLAGAAGLFGVHTSTVSTRSGGYSLAVDYPRVARAGLDTSWRAVVRHDGGFDQGLTLAISTNYFHMFETQGMYPDADSSTNDGTFVYFDYDKPPGDEFVLDYDAYIQPSSQVGKSAVVELIVGGRQVASVALKTWLMP